MRKKHKKWSQEGSGRLVCGMCGAAGEDWRGAIYCKSLQKSGNHARSFAKEFMQSLLFHSASPQDAADLIASRIPPGRVELGCRVFGLLAGCAAAVVPSRFLPWTRLLATGDTSSRSTTWFEL